MEFHLVGQPWNVGKYIHKYPCVELSSDNWNDYGYVTSFTVHYFNEKGSKTDIGLVKILSLENPVTHRAMLPSFKGLTKQFCSLGQSMSYYRILSELPEEVYKPILKGLKDMVYNENIYNDFPDRIGIVDSLLRSSEANKALKSAYDKYFLNKDIENEVFNFNFIYQAPYSTIENTVNFNFERHDFLPNRMSILVGKNGTGKTQLLSKFADALCGQADEEKAQDFFDPPVIPLFSKVIAVSFSAFDDFRKPYSVNDLLNKEVEKNIKRLDNTISDINEEEDKIEELSNNRKLNNYVYCGIQDDKGKTLSLNELKQHGSNNLLKIIKRENNAEEGISYLEKWKEVLLNIEIPSKYLDEPLEIFKSNLSSGQSILVSIITEVIANIENESILLIDEPELHLHPNAVSNLVRMLYHLLEEFNSYAIISTHSPLIIQEIPSFYINKLDRTEDDLLLISQLSIETFGENISGLINEVFNVKEVESNYKTLLKKAVNSGKSLEEIYNLFPYGLSLHALTYLNILYNQNKKRIEDNEI